MVSQFTSAEVLDRCLDADVPAVPVLDPSEVSSDPHVVAREAVIEVTHPTIGKMRVPRQGASFSAEKKVEPSAAPAYGEHTDEILSEIGFDSNEINNLRNSNIVV